MIPFFIKMNDCEDTRRLLRRPGDFALLALIAMRARRRDSRQNDGLDVGEGYVGDIATVGLTPRGYRTAKDRLTKDGLATFRTTSRGTIAKLVSTTVFIALGVNDDEQECLEATDQRQDGDELQATNREEDKKKRKIKYTSPSDLFSALLPQEQFRRLDLPELRNIYADWCCHRQQLRKPLKAKAVELDARHMLTVLDVGGVEDIKRRIELAIDRGWQGWFFANQQKAGSSVPSSAGMRQSDDPMKTLMQRWTKTGG